MPLIFRSLLLFLRIVESDRERRGNRKRRSGWDTENDDTFIIGAWYRFPRSPRCQTRRRTSNTLDRSQMEKIRAGVEC